MSFSPSNGKRHPCIKSGKRAGSRSRFHTQLSSWLSCFFDAKNSVARPLVFETLFTSSFKRLNNCL
ncbi:Uncharacterised protein [Vibrio cholerae]|nr:Uncharacterised protein [Vibrio cholerae]